MSDNKYTMKISLNVLEHLGIGLYSNTPAVLSEAVANAWDADAEHVTITRDSDKQIIQIEDDGHGMSVADANNKYLCVGYNRRANDGSTTEKGRKPMGRKGIGKLSLFAIADTITVESSKENQSHGFVMKASAIRDASKAGKDYHPEPVPSNGIKKGTRITLTDLKSHIRKDDALKKRLARRFSIIDEFEIMLDGEQISITDRGYHDKLEYIWSYGTYGENIASQSSAEKSNKLDCNVTINSKNAQIDGWIGTVKASGSLRGSIPGENSNKISVIVRGKMVQEDMLEEMGDSKIYSNYLVGEIVADFLDKDDEGDCVTTNRQKIMEDEQRYVELGKKIKQDLQKIASVWTEFRNEKGEKTALEIPQINDWFKKLDSVHRSSAKKLFGRINRLPIDDEDNKKQLFISGILAFESLKLRDMLDKLDEISVDDLSAIRDVFMQLDDLEASAYYGITKNRLKVIMKLQEIVDDDERERVIQELIFNHLWLIDPTWERNTTSGRMEQRITSEFKDMRNKYDDDELTGRMDIRYTTINNKHVIVELKRSSKVINTNSLISQIDIYRDMLRKALKMYKRSNEKIETICIVGKEPDDWDDPVTKKESEDKLHAIDTKIVLYEHIIDNALKAYSDYSETKQNISRIYKLITSIENKDKKQLRPEN